MIGHGPLRMLVVLMGTALVVIEVDCSRSYDLEPHGQFPTLFEYEDFESCRKAYRDQYVYCIVRARIIPNDDSQLWRNVSIFSEDSFHYDHRILERGMCVQNCYIHTDTSAAGNNQLSHLRACINRRLQEDSDLQIESDIQIYHCYNNANDSPPFGKCLVVRRALGQKVEGQKVEGQKVEWTNGRMGKILW